MRYVPGSHKYGIFDIVPDPERPVHHIPCTAGLSLPPPAPCPTPAGSIIFHHGCTLHCSDINHTETWRRAVILHFTTADARSENKRLNREVSMEID
jgi:ectoine hydroxylase-related dioxygenase (phytanoyl-CoA dioxygenase family)